MRRATIRGRPGRGRCGRRRGRGNRDDAPSSASAYFGANYYDQQGDRIGWTDSERKVTGDTDWTRVSQLFVVPPGTERVDLVLVLHGHGAAYFDRAQVEVGEEVTAWQPRQGAVPTAPSDQSAARPRIAILRDDLPATGSASDPAYLQELAVGAGCDALFLSADDLADPSRLGPGLADALVLPYGSSFPAPAVENLRDFLRSGSSLVSVGGYQNLGGPAWEEVGWRAPGFSTDFAAPTFRDLALDSSTAPTAAETPPTEGGEIDASVVEAKTFRGVNVGELAEGSPITDTRGDTVGWTRPWGRGRLIAYGIYPDSYATTPHPSVNMTGWIRQLIDLGGLEFTGRFMSDQPDTGEGHLGSGAPVVGVIVRVRSADEKLVFWLNQGGAGHGTVQVQVGGGTWQAEDIIAEEPLAGGETRDGVWRLGVDVKPWDYRVVRLVRTGPEQ